MAAYENQRAEIALSTQPDDPLPAWTDITPYVDGPIVVNRGRGSQFDQIQPSTLSLTLNNADHRFTPGNVSSPYYPNFRQARRIRVRETIGNRTFDIFSGYLVLPEITDWSESGIDQIIQVTAVDRLGRLDSARTLLSTLGEHILNAGGSMLQAYYPMLETGTASSFRDYFGVQPPMVVVRSDTSLFRQATAEPTYSPGGGTAAPGDDLPGLLFAPSTIALAPLAKEVCRAWAVEADFQQATNPSPPPRITLHAGDLLTLVAWFDLDATFDDYQFLVSFNLFDAGLSDFTLIQVTRNTFITTVASPGLLDALAAAGSGLAGEVVSTGTYTGGSPVPVAVQFGYSPNSLKCWVGGSEYSATPTGTITDPQVIYASGTIGPIAGSASHLQIYVGNYTRQMYLDQLDAGWTGLAYQTSGQRIATLADYAGVPTVERVLATGVTQMPPARLAGSKPSDGMRSAATAEQGRLFVDGAGNLVFQDRPTTYL